MQSDRPVIEITSPPEAPLPGSSMIGAVLFPAFALIGLALGLIYSMPWLITSSLAISLALLAVVGGTFLNRRDRAGKLRLDLAGGATRIAPAPAARLFPLVAGGLALLVILVNIALRLMGYFADENGLTFSLMVGLVIVWGLVDSWYGWKNPPGLKLTPKQVISIGNMGKETAVPWSQVSGAPTMGRGRITIPIGKGETQVGANQMDSDPRLVMALIDSYRGRPARQGELGDGRVLQRAKSLKVR